MGTARTPNAKGCSMKIELDDRGAGVTARPLTEPLTCHGTPIGTLGCGARVTSSDSAFHGYAQGRCGNCGRWGRTAWGIALPGQAADEVAESMRARAAEYWETKPTTTYGDL
jgi:hypothetical protein